VEFKKLHFPNQVSKLNSDYTIIFLTIRLTKQDCTSLLFLKHAMIPCSVNWNSNRNPNKSNWNPDKLIGIPIGIRTINMSRDHNTALHGMKEQCTGTVLVTIIPTNLV
jgi:hypothetical protein